MSELPTGTVTFLFTDIEGSTQLLRRLGPAYSGALAEHQEIVRAAVAAHHGREVDTQGDSFFIAFRRGKDAVAAAVAIQRDLASHAWPEGGVIRVRIGLHTGEPQVGEERYVGMGVNKAARIGAAGHGGQVLISRTTRDLVEDELPPGVTTRDLGDRRLKDIERPEHLFQLVIEGLESNFGQLKTLDVELQRKRRRMYAAAALIGVLAAAVAIPVFALGGGGGGGGTSVEPNSVAVIDPAANKVIDSVPVGVDPEAITFGAGSVWVANTADGTVSRIDPQALRAVRTIPVGEYPSDIAAAAGSAWVVLGGLQQVREIDAESNSADRVITIANAGTGDCVRVSTRMAPQADTLWVTCNADDQTSNAFRINVRTEVQEHVEEALVSSSPVAAFVFSDVAAGLGSAWMVNRGSNEVTQIDARTLATVRQVTVGRAPAADAVGLGAVWVANADDDTVSRIDAANLAQTLGSVLPATIAVGDVPSDVAAGAGAVWVVNSGDRTISRIDPKAGNVVATIKLENEPVRVAAGAGSVWVTVQEAAS